jgi:hypothetical protein
VNETKPRPGWVWFISIWYTGGFVLGIVLTLLVWSGRLRLNPQGQAYFAKMTTLDIAFSVMQMLLVETAAITLFLLRKQATYFFWLVFGAGLASDFYYHILNHLPRKSDVWGKNPLLYIGTQLAVCIYCQSLKWKGTLT